MTMGGVLASCSSQTTPTASTPTSPSDASGTDSDDESDVRPRKPTNYDVEATKRASERLRKTLQALARRPSFALGHEDTTAYGVGWHEDPDRSDVKSVCGAHAAVRGWDLFRIENGATENGDGVRFDLMRTRITEAHRHGAINTISWHVDNPATSGDAWDTKGRPVEQVLPGRPLHAKYKAGLDAVADFLSGLRGDEGELIPVVFRPFHEHTGSWFWWGASQTTEADYIALWRFTVDYLRAERGLDHLLFAFSPDGQHVHNDEEYFFRYPGDEYVDVLGIDMYYANDGSEIVQLAEIVVRVARAHGKIPALTEFGARDGINQPNIASATWIRSSFLEPLKASPTALGIAYALAWRNARPDHAFLPYPGHVGEAGFKAFCADSAVVLEDDIAQVELDP